MNVAQAIKDATAKREALDAYKRAHRRMDRAESDYRASGQVEEAQRVHVLARAAGMAFVLEKSNPVPEGLTE